METHLLYIQGVYVASYLAVQQVKKKGFFCDNLFNYHINFIKYYNIDQILIYAEEIMSGLL